MAGSLPVDANVYDDHPGVYVPDEDDEESESEKGRRYEHPECGSEEYIEDYQKFAPGWCSDCERMVTLRRVET